MAVHNQTLHEESGHVFLDSTIMPPKSNKERQLEFRRRRDSDPEKRQAYLETKKEKYRNDVKTKKRKPIGEQTEREKRKQRKEWRRNKREERKRKKTVTVDTPPLTPENEPSPSCNRNRGRKRVKRDRAKCYRDNRKLLNALAVEKRAADRYRKKYERLLKKTTTKGTPSPRSKTKHLLRHWRQRKEKDSVSRTLTFHYSVLSDFKNKYKKSSEQDKNKAARFVCGKLIRKYRLVTMAQEQLAINTKGWQWIQGTGSAKEHQRRQRLNPIHSIVRDFYSRDDVSRMTTGVKNTLTRCKIKKQRRLLLDSLKNLHQRFLAEIGLNVSYALFCRLRPFFVVEPTELDRQTCQCKIHENLQFMATALKKLGLLQTENLDEIFDKLMCRSDSKECAYSACPECKDRKLHPILSSTHKPNEEISYQQWVIKKVPHPCTENKMEKVDKTMTIISKDQIKSTLEELVGEFNKKAVRFKQHRFNIWNQYRVYKQIRETLKEGECLCHIDFSENFACKFSDEVQSMHFGGSHQQASLHTGVYYTKDGVFPFCSITPSRQHDPPAIWAHLEPILRELRDQNIKVLHMFSDGPVTQYKQKCNFYYMCHEPFSLGFEHISWHYFEACHGKGAPDGIGGVLKRTANRLVRQGQDIADAKVLYNKLNETDSTVRLFYIENDEVAKRTEALKALGPLPTIKGTMRIHQVVCLGTGRFEYRDISCVCGVKDKILNCGCFDPKKFEMHISSQTDQTEVISSTGVVKTGNRKAFNGRSLLVKPVKYTAEHEYGFCVVIYDDKLYPGQIRKVTENGEIEVDCMKSTGRNRFYWPGPRKDLCTYSEEEVLCLIPEPDYVDGRRPYFSVNQDVWREIEDQYL